MELKPSERSTLIYLLDALDIEPTKRADLVAICKPLPGASVLYASIIERLSRVVDSDLKQTTQEVRKFLR